MNAFMKKLYKKPVVLCWTLLKNRQVVAYYNTRREAKKWKDFMGGTVAKVIAVPEWQEAKITNVDE